MVNFFRTTHLRDPLYVAVLEVAFFWVIADLGYYYIFPFFTPELSYNLKPLVFSLYFFLWSIFLVYYYWDMFGVWLREDTDIWRYVTLSLSFAILIWSLLFVFSFMPALSGPKLAPYTDILFATPWYFLPKAIEILVQQLLVLVLVIALHRKFRELNLVIISYALLFGGAHVVTYLATVAPTQYAAMMTIGAMLSSLVFPYFILKVKGGFVHSYCFHLIFYIILALLLHTWPPPGYALL